MIRIQVVGCPLKLHRRFKSDLADFAIAHQKHAQIRYVPSDDEFRAGFTAAQIRESFTQGFYHVALFPIRRTAANDTQLKSLGESDYRFSWLRFDGDLMHIEWGALNGELERVIEYEIAWSAAIKPSDHNHPLLLPPTAFEPVHTCLNYWKACDCYSDKRRISAASAVLELVRKTHRTGQGGAKWVDRRDRQFSFDRSAHGHSLEDRKGLPRARFCYTVNAGFHFDVVHAHGRHFTVKGHDGLVHSQIARANIDPWGIVRAPD